MSEPASVATAFDPASPLLAAISADAPAGKDLAYDPRFERLSAELEKLSTLTAATPDWAYVIAECERVLRDESKDLRAMTWLAVAKSQVQGWRGVAEGIALCVALSKAYWPLLHPPLKRIRARAGQVDWLWRAMAKRVTAMPVGPAEADTVRALESLVAEAGAFFADRLQSADPGISPLRISVREKIRNLPAPAPPPSPPATSDKLNEATAADKQNKPSQPTSPSVNATENVAPAMAVGARATPAAPPPAIAPKIVPEIAPEIANIAVDPSSLSGLDSAQDLARKLRDPLAAIARHARHLAPASPWPYRMARVAAWLTVERAPEVDQGKTFLRGPKNQDREELTTLLKASQWDALLNAAEDAVVTHVFWLDPHRFSCIALEQKGPEYRAARQAVGRELVAFLKRISGIPHLLFSTGTPFAAPDTLDWIEQEMATFGGSTRGSSASTGQAVDPALEEILSAMTTQLASGNVDGALGDALANAERLSSARSRFRVHLAVAKHAQASARNDLALALYERILLQVNETLEQWEPTLSAEALEGFLKTMRISSRKIHAEPIHASPRNPKEISVFQRLLAVDPRAALRLRGQND